MGVYSDGSAWCFGCHYFVSGANDSGVIHHSRIEDTSKVKLPDDICQDFPEHVMKWLSKYEITIEEVLHWKWLYSPYWDQLIFPFYGESNELLFWQARNFKEGSKRKYYNQGTPSDLLPIFRATKETNSLCVVEDAVSAAKIARQSDAMPCLGSHLPVKKIMRLRPFYEVLNIWLDSDKYKESVEIADKAKWLGFKTRVIYTELDPKEYDDTAITSFISG